MLRDSWQHFSALQVKKAKRKERKGAAINSNIKDWNLLRIEFFDSERYVVWYQMNTDFEWRV